MAQRGRGQLTRLGWRTSGSRDPCTNGQLIGSIQNFSVFCSHEIYNIDFMGSPISAPDFSSCADSCAMLHPRCDAVAFNGASCYRVANVTHATTPASFTFDVAYAIFPKATSSCKKTSDSAIDAGGKRFTPMCAQNINGGDIQQAHAETYQDCLGVCAARSDCTAVSYDASMNSGFQNCFLKNGLSNDQIFPFLGVDSAKLESLESGPVAGTSPKPPSPLTSADGQLSRSFSHSYSYSYSSSSSSSSCTTTSSSRYSSSTAVLVSTTSSFLPASSASTSLVATTSSPQPLGPSTSLRSTSLPPTPPSPSPGPPTSSTSTQPLMPSTSIPTSVPPLAPSTSRPDPPSASNTSSTTYTIFTSAPTPPAPTTPFPTLTPSSVPSLATTTSTAQPGNTSTPTTPVQAEADNKSWIAAPIAGSAAALILLGFLFFWLRRREKVETRLSRDELESWRKPQLAEKQEAEEVHDDFETRKYSVRHGRLSQWSRNEGTIEIGLAPESPRVA